MVPTALNRVVGLTFAGDTENVPTDPFVQTKSQLVSVSVNVHDAYVYGPHHPLIVPAIAPPAGAPNPENEHAYVPDGTAVAVPVNQNACGGVGTEKPGDSVPAPVTRSGGIAWAGAGTSVAATAAAATATRGSTERADMVSSPDAGQVPAIAANVPSPWRRAVRPTGQTCYSANVPPLRQYTPLSRESRSSSTR